MLYLRLFVEFFKVGLFSIGGGLATYPFLADLGEKTGWYTMSELADMLAVSESTPGPIGVNMATYVGFTCGGVPGSLVATLSLVLPSVIVILLVAKVLQAFRTNRLVDDGFYGLRPASTAMIAAAGLGVVKIAFLSVDAFLQSGMLSQLVQWKAVILAGGLLVVTRWIGPTKKLHPIVWILISAAVGIVFHFAENP